MSAQRDTYWDQFEGPKASAEQDYWAQFKSADQYEQPKEQRGYFEGAESDTGMAKPSARYAAQIPLGLLQGTRPSMALSGLQFAAQAAAEFPKTMNEGLSPEEQQGLGALQAMGLMPSLGIAPQIGAAVEPYIPTQAKAEQFLEEKYGLPLRPLNKAQEDLRMASMLGMATPEAPLQAAQTGVIGAGVARGLKASGMPEPLADLIGGYLGAKSPKVEATPKTSPHGLPKRIYENLTRDRKVGSSKIDSVNRAVFNDVNTGIQGFLERNSPQYQQYAQNPRAYADTISSRIEQLRPAFQSSNEIANLSEIRRLMRQFRENFRNDPIADSHVHTAYEKEYGRLVRSMFKNNPSPSNAISSIRLYDKYRQNNHDASKHWEPGKSSATNEGTRRALADFNRALVESLENQNPGSQNAAMLRNTNADWAAMENYNTIQQVIDSTFPEGGSSINFQAFQKALSDPNTRKAFRDTMGKEFNLFREFGRDFLELEPAHRHMRRAGDKSFFGTKWDKFKAAADARNELLSWQQQDFSIKPGATLIP